MPGLLDGTETVGVEKEVGKGFSLLAWNTRAPILSAEEMEMLEALKDGKGD